jgi:hypothetical protein
MVEKTQFAISFTLTCALCLFVALPPSLVDVMVLSEHVNGLQGSIVVFQYGGEW